MANSFFFFFFFEENSIQNLLELQSSNFLLFYSQKTNEWICKSEKKKKKNIR